MCAEGKRERERWNLLPKRVIFWIYQLVRTYVEDKKTECRLFSIQKKMQMIWQFDEEWKEKERQLWTTAVALKCSLLVATEYKCIDTQYSLSILNHQNIFISNAWTKKLNIHGLNTWSVFHFRPLWQQIMIIFRRKIIALFLKPNEDSFLLIRFIVSFFTSLKGISSSFSHFFCYIFL